MVIQRWQTVFLLLAVIMMAVLCFSPFAQVGTDGSMQALHTHRVPVFLVVNILIAVLLFLSIFMYRNLRRQMMVTLVSMVLIAASMATGAFILYDGYAKVELLGTDILLIGALFMAVAAYSRMRKDKRTLSSYDRIR